MDQSNLSVSPNSSNRRFFELPELWLRVFVMNEAFFSSELPYASISNTAFSVLLVTVCTLVFTIIGALLGWITRSSNMPAGVTSVNAVQIVSRLTIIIACCGIIVTPLSFYLNNGIVFISARIFGGKGSFSSQTYLDSLYYVPLAVFSGFMGLVSAVPKVGLAVVSIVTFAIAVYSLILRARAFKVVHGLSTGKAFAAILAPVILILIPTCLIGLLMIMGPAIGNVFSSINSQLGTPVP